MINIKNTLANFFRQYIEFENTASPAEAMNFIRKNKIFDVQGFLKKTEKLILEGNEEVRPFLKKRLSSNVYFYTTTNENKNLLICFCGNANRLMLPIPVFLQYIDHKVYDVLVLMDPSKLCYHLGVPGFGSTIEESADLLSDIATRGKYQQVKTFGTSGGGCASLFCGVYLNANKSISVGGRHPLTYEVTNNLLSDKGYSGYEFEELLSKKSNQYQTKIYIIYGNRMNADKISAENFEKYFLNTTLVPIDHDGHDVINFLRNKQELRILLDELVNNE